MYPPWHCHFFLDPVHCDCDHTIPICLSHVLLLRSLLYSTIMQDNDVVFEVNANGWAPSGAATALSLHDEDPARLPTAGVGHGRKPSGRYVLAAGRAGEEDGLRQAITPPGALKPRVTYRVVGWISVAAAGEEVAEEDGRGHPVRVSIRVDGGSCGVVDGGAVCGQPGRWAEIKGAFRLREKPGSAAVHVHGAPAGVEVKVMDLRIIATDRKARFRHLKDKTDKVLFP